MALAVDLHSHSSYAGGAGTINLQSLAVTMSYKGINIFGLGDCQFPVWQKIYLEQLKEQSNGLYNFPGTAAYFIRQTEVIFTVALEDYPNRIVAHHVILFPDDASMGRFVNWMERKGHKNTIARPFIVCRNQSELEDSLFEIQAIDPWLEIIPAHILTPDGILGSKNNLHSWKEFYGDFTDQIHTVETGLSADPDMLSQIPDLQGRAFISSSDCHSAGLNKVGREFTLLNTDEISYEAVIKSIRNRQVLMTAEFPPSEGRYYLTGHRADRHPDKTAVCFQDMAPEDGICPVCGKKMLTGVRDRAEQLSDESLPATVQPFLHLVPLIEVIACALGVKSIANVRVRSSYDTCISVFSTEIELWQSPVKIIQELLDSKLPQEIIQHIISVRAGEFLFDPPGFDGTYGRLKITGSR
jgi:uncharacterized protein (TIGR00375 family)